MKRLPTYQPMRMGHVKHIHFVGIGGVGMCGIAEVLYNEGYHISGSDAFESKYVNHLRKIGIRVYIGHHPNHIQDADVIVVSSAIPQNNPEVIAARERQIPIIPRAAMLAELMRFRHGIAIAGTHGKTTTTSLVTSLLTEGGLDPSYVIGGKLNSSGANAQLGHSPYFVAEADESDASFLFLKPMMAVVTNIDADHLQTYNDNFDTLCDAFVEFLHHLPFYGLAVVCHDDPVVESIIPKIARPFRTYGYHEQCHYRATNWVQDGLVNSFTVVRPSPYQALHIQFGSPGRHNVLNALAAIAIATELGVSDEAIQAGFKKFEGVGRRFQLLGEKDFQHGKALVIDDYGHHPREIRSTIDAFRSVWPKKRLVHVFQPHRYTRTESLFSDFVEVLSMADEVLLLDIYPAGEQAIQGISSFHLAEKVNGLYQNKVKLVGNGDIEHLLDEVVQDGDAILMQGAGSIGQMAYQLTQKKIGAS
jgi:UDP-N-acetylmuramate--alanine ligase